MIDILAKEILRENESPYRAMYSTSVDSWLSNMADITGAQFTPLFLLFVLALVESVKTIYVVFFSFFSI